MNANELGRVPLSAEDIVSIVKQMDTERLRGKWLKIQHAVTNQVSQLKVEGGRLYYSHSYGGGGIGDVSPEPLMVKGRSDAWLILGLTSERSDNVDVDTDLEVMPPPITGAALVSAYAVGRRAVDRIRDLMADPAAVPSSFEWQREVRRLMLQVSETWGAAAKAAASVNYRRTTDGKV